MADADAIDVDGLAADVDGADADVDGVDTDVDVDTDAVGAEDSFAAEGLDGVAVDDEVVVPEDAVAHLCKAAKPEASSGDAFSISPSRSRFKDPSTLLRFDRTEIK